MPIARAVPVLRVADVARSVAWYREALGFAGDPFPAEPPHAFAMLRHGPAEMMFRRGERTARARRGRMTGTFACGSKGAGSASCSRG